MKKWLVLLGLAMILVAATAKATIIIQSVDANTSLLYTQTTIGIDVNIMADQNFSNYKLQLWDNNALREEKIVDGNTPDTDLHYFLFQFALQFTEGTHVLDVNVGDADHPDISRKILELHITANPWVPDTNMSWDLIQQYLLPLARSYSICIAEKADLNVLYTQAGATTKALENDVAIANNAKNASEKLLSDKESELASTSSARATCDADKATVDSKLANASADCETQKNELKNDEQSNCDDKLNIKDETISGFQVLVSTKDGEKSQMELFTFTFGCLFFLTCGAIAFLVIKGRIKA